VARVALAELEEGRLPALFPALWRGAVLPSGPFKPRGIESFAAPPETGSSQ